MNPVVVLQCLQQILLLVGGAGYRTAAHANCSTSTALAGALRLAQCLRHHLRGDVGAAGAQGESTAQVGCPDCRCRHCGSRWALSRSHARTDCCTWIEVQLAPSVPQLVMQVTVVSVWCHPRNELTGRHALPLGNQWIHMAIGAFGPVLILDHDSTASLAKPLGVGLLNHSIHPRRHRIVGIRPQILPGMQPAAAVAHPLVPVRAAFRSGQDAGRRPSRRSRQPRHTAAPR